MTYDKRFYGIYEGLCTNNEDPDNLYKIKLKVPQVLGDYETNWSAACLPVTDNSTHDAHTDVITSSSALSGLSAHTHTVTLDASHSDHIKVPKVGQKVWVMFIAGDPNFPVWMGVGLNE